MVCCVLRNFQLNNFEGADQAHSHVISACVKWQHKHTQPTNVILNKCRTTPTPLSRDSRETSRVLPQLIIDLNNYDIDQSVLGLYFLKNEAYLFLLEETCLYVAGPNLLPTHAHSQWE